MPATIIKWIFMKIVLTQWVIYCADAADLRRMQDSLQRHFSFPRFTSEQKQQPMFVIRETFYSTGMFIHEQVLYSYTGQKGKNIIGISTGYLHGSLDDIPVIIAAHYDTVENTGGISDNGSGVVGILELAHLFFEAASLCAHANSVILVALDFSEAAYFESSQFVNEWLPEHMITSANIIVLDSILNFDPFPTSQGIAKNFETMFPTEFKEIDSHSYMGDFVQITARNGTDKLITKTILKSFQDRLDDNLWAQNAGVWILPVRVPESHLNSGNGLQDYKSQMQGDHRSFWLPKNEKLKNISCVLISDTGQYRGQLQYCHRSYCDGLNLITKPNMRFLQITVDTVFSAALQLANTICINNSNQTK